MAVKFLFGMVDANGDGKLDEGEWNKGSDITANSMKGAEHGLTAIRLDGSRDRVRTETLWINNKSVSEVPSPLVIEDHVYMIKNGGILTCMNRQTGEVLYRRRLKTPGPYYASPVTVNDQIIAVSGDGIVSVFKSGSEFELTSTNDMNEEILATPAVSAGAL